MSFITGLCLIIAGFIALNGQDGWGWFLAAAVFVGEWSD
jgi:hypothetical protein